MDRTGTESRRSDGPDPPRVVLTRRLEIDYTTDEQLPRHYVQGDVAMSHVVSMLSAVFPEGLIRSPTSPDRPGVGWARDIPTTRGQPGRL